MPKIKKIEEQLINDHEAEKNLPEILRHAITQADYLDYEILGNQIVPNRFTHKEYILTPLAFQVYTVGLYAHDIIWALNDLSKAINSLPVTVAGAKLVEETKKQHQKIDEDNREIFNAAREWFIDYYTDEYMGLMD